MSSKKMKKLEWDQGDVARYQGVLVKIISLQGTFFPSDYNDLGYPTVALLEELETGRRTTQPLFDLERVSPLEALGEQAG